MAHQYAFYVDSSSCSGCKTCQAACKDKHNLSVGQCWRRVIEVQGGGWERQGQAWVSTVYAYHLSMGCNHCEEPICVEVCPTKAMLKRRDGIVVINQERCIGCRYCSWACPYGAPQYDAELGKMGKCDLCYDQLEQAKPPICVAACPLRALDFGELSELQARYGLSNAVKPLPDEALTRPALVVKPHPDAGKT